MDKNLEVFQEDLHSLTVTEVADAFIQLRNALITPPVQFLSSFSDVVPQRHAYTQSVDVIINSFRHLLGKKNVSISLAN